MTRVGGALQDIGRSLGLRDEPAESAKRHAYEAIATRLEQALHRSTEEIIALHGLEGRAKTAMLARLSTSVLVDAPVSESRAAMMGGVVSGALTGLAADLATGGLTLGAGLVTGAVLGALGGAGIARGMNMVRGKSGPLLRWDDAFISGLVASALLRYLAVAHFGRGRGEWTETEPPPEWSTVVTEIVQGHRDDLARLWAKREPSCDAGAIETGVRQVVGDCAREVLERLYPGAFAYKHRNEDSAE